MTLVYIGVGSNIDKEKHTKVAIEELKAFDPALKVSPIYQCAPVGFDSQPFYNFVVALTTEKTLTVFSHELRKIELKWGRPKEAKKYQDRTLDLDILLFGEEISADAPQVPREDIFQYSFVIQPLYDLAPELVIPGDGRTVKMVWQQAKDLSLLTEVKPYFGH